MISGQKDMFGAAFTFLLGLCAMSLTLLSAPFGMVDADGDGISDTYQRITVRTDLVLGPEGEWEEVELGRTSEMDVPFMMFIGVLLLVVLPAVVFIYVHGSARRMEERDRRSLSSVMQDNVRRTAAFLEINPSLLSAIKSAHLSQSEREGRVLGRLLWEVRCKGRTFDGCMHDLSEGWSREEPMLGRAIEGLRSAETEPTDEDVQCSARRVVERLSEESREKMASYGRSLSGPSSALFGLGVLLPVLLATMVPIAGIGGRTTYMLGFFLWVVLPASILAFGGSLVRRRPRFSATEPAKGPLRPHLAPINVALCLSGALSFAFLFWRALGGSGLDDLSFAGLDGGEVGLLLSICGASMVIAGCIDILSRGAERARLRDESVGSAIPDLLNDIGAFLLEGKSFEAAVKRAAGRAKGPVREELDTAVTLPGLQRGPSCQPGLDRALLAAKEFSRAGREPGGKAVRALSGHLSELSRLNREMREKVKQSVGQMEVTSSVFAPLMIGSSAGIFKLLDGAGDALGSGSMVLSGPADGSMGASAFIFLSGVYLMLLSVVTTLTFHRLEHGVERGGWHKVPKRLVQSAFAFTAGVVLSSLLLGG